MATATKPGKHGQRDEEAVLRLHLLGGFKVDWQGERLPESAWKRPQARLLLKLLATERAHRLHREQLIERLWPEQDPEDASGRLRNLLYVVRRSLPGEAGSAFEQRDETVLLDPKRVWIDADAFEAAARSALGSGSMEAMEAALALYGGELLPEERYAEWAGERRQDLAALHRRLMLATAHIQAQRGEPREATARLQQLLSLDPAHEAAHRELMRLYAASGNRREALRQYERCREVLAQVMGVEPDPETESLRRQIEAGTTAFSAPVLPPAVTRPWRTPLIGRERALNLVLVPPIPQRGDREPAASTEQVGVVLVRGEAGVGKTRLAAEAAREAGSRGCMVLWGSCDGRAAYGPFIEALEQYVGRLTPAERTGLADRHPELARILPSLDAAPAPPSIGGAGDELRLFAAVARLMNELAAVLPLLLVLDDLQSADEATLALLGYLARLPAVRRKWLILGTYRIEEVGTGSKLAAALAEMQRGISCRQVDLLRLGRRECLRLAERVLGGTVAGAAADHIFRTSLGNPLFAVELTRALQSSGELIQTENGWDLAGSGATLISAQVADLIAARIATLDEKTQRLLALAAVAGTSAPVTVLQHAAGLLGWGIEGFLDGLERAIEARVLEEEPGAVAGSYGFQHPLFREVMYAQLETAHRSRLHGVVARATEIVLPAEVEALAYHYHRSGDREKQILYLEKAGDRARLVYANTLAEAHYRELLGLLSAPEDADHRARAQLKLGAVLDVVGRYAEALEVLEEAAAGLTAAGDPDGHGRAVAAIGRAYVMRGMAGEAVERLERAVAELGARVGPLVLSDLADALARCLVALGRYAEAESVSAEASAQLRDCADSPEGRGHLARAELQRASAAYFVRPAAEAQSILVAVMPVIQRSGDPELLINTYNLAAYSALTAGDLSGSCRYYEQALEAAERTGNPGRSGRFRCLLGRSHFFVGRGEEGLRIAEEGYAQLAGLGPSLYLAFGSHMLGVIYLGMGRWREARERFAEVARVASENREAMRLAAYREAELDLLEGKALDARDRLIPLVSPDALGYDSVLVSAHLAWAYAALGEADRALEIGDLAIQQARRIESRLCLVEVLGAWATTLIELHRWDAAEQALEEGLELARAMEHVWHQALGLLLRARLHHRRGESDCSLEYLFQGQALLQRLGGEQAVSRAHVYAGMPES